MAEVGALIIASTPGSGFGGAMALGLWSAESVLDHLVEVVHDADIEDITVVVGPRSEEILGSFDRGDTTIVIDSDWAEGLSSGLRAGLDTMWRSSNLETAVIVEIDRPGISSETIVAMLSAHREGDAPVMIPKYRYTRGGPIAVERVLWPRLMGLEGNVDLVALLEVHKEWAAEVWIDRVPPAKIDTAPDLEALVRGW